MDWERFVVAKTLAILVGVLNEDDVAEVEVVATILVVLHEYGVVAGDVGLAFVAEVHRNADDADRVHCRPYHPETDLLRNDHLDNDPSAVGKRHHQSFQTAVAPSSFDQHAFALECVAGDRAEVRGVWATVSATDVVGWEIAEDRACCCRGEEDAESDRGAAESQPVVH